MSTECESQRQKLNVTNCLHALQQLRWVRDASNLNATLASLASECVHTTHGGYLSSTDTYHQNST
jgi:hypothetical protein